MQNGCQSARRRGAWGRWSMATGIAVPASCTPPAPGGPVAHLDVMLEQPCKTLEDCAAVRQATGLPMKIDEGAHDLESLLKAHDLGVLDAVALKLSKFGGLSAMRRARDPNRASRGRDLRRMHLGL